MLAISGRPQADLREGQRQGARLPVQWVTITNPDPARAITTSSPKGSPREAPSSTG